MNESIVLICPSRSPPALRALTPDAQPPRCTRRILPAPGGTCAPAKGACARHPRAAPRLLYKADHCVREFSPKEKKIMLKKICSVVLAALLLQAAAVPAFAESNAGK